LWSVGIELDFAAAHLIPNHPKCGKLHGHNYRTEIRLLGDALNSMGFLIDFGDLKAAASNVIAALDHSFLNESIPKEYQPTSAEHIAAYIHHNLSESLGNRVKLEMFVRVWETQSSWAEYGP
jgi:6-pyruvoyltetrahydropterin/6-carboxytetrahydropterin synthase